MREVDGDGQAREYDAIDLVGEHRTEIFQESSPWKEGENMGDDFVRKMGGHGGA